MMRAVVAAGAVMLFVSAVVAQQDIAKQQDDLMRSIAKPYYGVLMKMSRGQIPYDQAAIETALTQVEQDVGKIAVTFEKNPGVDPQGTDYVASPKVWQNKPDFDSKIPKVTKTIAEFKGGKIKDVETLAAAWKTIDNSCNECHDTYRINLKKK